MPSLDGAKTQALTNPTSVRAQLLAAFTCQEAGDAEAAARFFDRALELGLPIDQKLRFYFGFGAALRSVGRLEESEKVLRHAIGEYPYDKALPVHLALTLHKSGRDDEAMAELLELLVRLRDTVKDFAQHKEEILAHARELRERTGTGSPPA